MPRKKQQYGSGSVYKKTKKGPDGVMHELPNFYIQYFVNGHMYRESTGTDIYNKAMALLKKRYAEAEAGTLQTAEIKHVLVGELLDDLYADYTQYHPQSADRFAKHVIAHLRPHFGQILASKLSTSDLKKYITARLKDGAAQASVNRDLALLRRSFKLAQKHTPPKVTSIPSFAGLLFRENNARQGFFEHDEYTRMRDALPRDERDILVYAYYTGCRRSEILKLQWQFVDVASRCVRLPSEDKASGLHMKSNEARIIPLGDELYEMLAARQALVNEVCPASPWVFCHTMNANRGRAAYQIGKPKRNIYGTWIRVSKELGITRLLHDLRRTGVRNLVRAGVPESVAMKISGHKTRSVFERYNIVNEGDLHDAAKKLNDYVGKAPVVVSQCRACGTARPRTRTTAGALFCDHCDAPILEAVKGAA